MLTHSTGLDLFGAEHLHGSQARIIELAHCPLVDSANVMQGLHRFMDGGESIAGSPLLGDSATKDSSHLPIFRLQGGIPKCIDSDLFFTCKTSQPCILENLQVNHRMFMTPTCRTKYDN